MEILTGAGGIAFGTGAGSATAVVKDPASFSTSGSWIPVAVGVLIALTTHLTKSAARPVINAATIGTAAPVVSTAEDASSVGLSFISLLIPILVAVIIVGVVIVMRRRFQRKRELETQPGPTTIAPAP